MNEQDCTPLTSFQGDSPVSLTVLQGNGLEKQMNGIFGRNSCALSENLNQEPLWVRMCMGYYQQFMTPFAPTWSRKTTASGRFVYQLTLLEHTLKDTGWVLLPCPTASQDYKPIRKQSPSESRGKHGKSLPAGIGTICPECIGQYINPRFSEWLMGFPEEWTDV